MIGRDEVAKRVPRGTFERLDRYVALLSEASTAQNLIAQSTLPDIWQRHVLDSLQLLDLRTPSGGWWVDVGSGAGLPGLVIAIASQYAVKLIEPRRRRAEFLRHAVDDLQLGERVDVIARSSNTVRLAMPAAVISARAVAPLDQLLGVTIHMGDRATCWILPKGRSAAQEVAVARQAWQGDFRLVPSITQPEAAIVVASDVRRRGL